MEVVGLFQVFGLMGKRVLDFYQGEKGLTPLINFCLPEKQIIYFVARVEVVSVGTSFPPTMTTRSGAVLFTDHLCIKHSFIW